MNDRKKTERNKILIRLPNWIGDAVMATPFLHAVRRVFPEARITLLGRRRIMELLLHFPGCDERWLVDDQPMASLVRRMRSAGFDRGFLLTNSFRSALTFFLAQVRERIGYALDLRRVLLNHPLPATGEILRLPMVEYYMNLLSDFTDISQIKREMKLYPSEQEREQAKSLLVQNGWDGARRLVGINPFSHKWITKRWLPERFAELADRLIDRYGVQCVFVSEERDRPLLETIKGMCRNPLMDLVGKAPLSVIPALLENYSLFITNDSGLMHVAAAMGTPLVALFGSTDWRRTAPYTDRAILIRKAQDHEPCMKPVCSRDFACMKQISADEVFAETARYLKL